MEIVTSSELTQLQKPGVKKSFHSDPGFILSIRCLKCLQWMQQQCNDTLPFLVFDCQ